MKDKYIILFLLIHYFFLRLYGKDLSEAIKVPKEKYCQDYLAKLLKSYKYF